MLTPTLVVALALAQPSPAAPADKAAKLKPLVPFPHPLITEVLFAVPTGTEGDASGDGARQVAGDEFVEVVNPHDKPIELRGYVLADKRASEKTKSGKPKSGAVRFVFPACRLEPGQVAVIFNGHGCTFEPPVGDEQAQPDKGHDKYAGALLFSMKTPTERAAFSNTADWVLLSDPQGNPINLIKWGSVEGPDPQGTLLVEEAPQVMRASVQRTSLTGTLGEHPETEGARFSPGLFDNPLRDGKRTPSKKPETKPEEKPEAKPDAKPAPKKP
jgi:hypothetical protein